MLCHVLLPYSGVVSMFINVGVAYAHASAFSRVRGCASLMIHLLIILKLLLVTLIKQVLLSHSSPATPRNFSEVTSLPSISTFSISINLL